MTVSVENPRDTIERAGGKPVKINKVLDDPELGKVDLREHDAHVLTGKGYVDENGTPREYVQLDTGGLVAVPKDALSRKSARSSLSHMAQSVWDRIFGKKKD